MDSVQGKIIGFSGRDAFLLVRGQAMKVSLDGIFREGQDVSGRIVKSGEGLVLQTDGRQSAANTAESGGGKQVLSDFFRQTGVPATEFNFLTAFKAMQLGQALSPELFSSMNRYLSFLPDISENSLHALLFSLLHGLPIHQKTISAMKNWLDNGAMWQGLFATIFGREFTKKAEVSRFLPELAARSPFLRKLLADLGFETERRLLSEKNFTDLPTELFRSGAGELAAKLKDFVSLLKLLNSGRDSEEPLLLVLPYLEDGELRDLVLKSWKKPSKQGGFAYNLEIYLSMSALGDMSLRFMLEGGFLRLEVLCRESEGREFMAENEGLFLDELRRSGIFRQVSVNFLQGDFAVPVPMELKSVEPSHLDIKI